MSSIVCTNCNTGTIVDTGERMKFSDEQVLYQYECNKCGYVDMYEEEDTVDD